MMFIQHRQAYTEAGGFRIDLLLDGDSRANRFVNGRLSHGNWPLESWAEWARFEAALGSTPTTAELPLEWNGAVVVP